ncbi:hypothetical protein [Nesterenkonia muleiensis]|uniref:hypothetical protein n=1 Tax=Nesterenkonia muleiensis TaxID=2282648 RepID=UPI00192E4206|nr:hypothetical protein [Nesterenkonia muleiensis]
MRPQSFKGERTRQGSAISVDADSAGVSRAGTGQCLGAWRRLSLTLGFFPISEYQYYEFLAIDQPLDQDQLSDIRTLSTRASITANSFVNEYHWGDFRGDVTSLMSQFYDAHLYWANWGTRRVMFRIPRSALDTELIETFCVEDHVEVQVAGEWLILDITSEQDDGYDYDPDNWFTLSSVVGIREELLAGDLRGLYLAWLAALSQRESDDAGGPDALEPPLPPGLNELSPAQQVLAEFLQLDEDLFGAAREASPPLHRDAQDSAARTWVQQLLPQEKDRIILSLLEKPAAARTELLGRIRQHSSSETPGSARRRARQLLDLAEERRVQRQEAQAQRRAEQRAKREAAEATARQERLARVSADQQAAWSEVDAAIGQKTAEGYTLAVEVLKDLREIAEREGTLPQFSERLSAIRQAHRRKVSLMRCLNEAEGLGPDVRPA